MDFFIFSSSFVSYDFNTSAVLLNAAWLFFW